MSVSLFNQNLKEARRDALVGHFLATHDFSSLPEGSSVTTADDLYEYLLLDTKISNAVTTSRLAEAISSLQLFIHRALEGYDGELSGSAKQYLEKDAFLDNWDQYNKRYSTWAGKEKLRFYAGNYVEPSLRINKTQLFKELENNISQGKLTSTLVAMALDSYITGYDRYSNMTHLYAGSGNADNSRLYLTGKMNSQYYWREVRLQYGKPIYWSDWNSLPAPIDSPLEDKVVMMNDQGVIICEWLSKERLQCSDKVESIVMYHRWTLNRNGDWELVLKEPEIIFDVEIEYLDESDVTWKSSNSMDYVLKKGVEVLSGSIDFDPVAHKTTYYVEEASNESYLWVYGMVKTGQSVIVDSDKDSGEVKDWTIESEERSKKILGQITTFYNKPYEIEPYGSIYDGFVYVGDNIKFSVEPPASAKNLGNLLDNGIANLLNYNKQKTIAENSNWYYEDDQKSGDAFNGPYGQYLWEIFFHVPYLIATRFATEQRFEEAECWYKYIFNSAGYRDEDGNIQTDDNSLPRYWNCYPLQQDVAWDSFTDMSASTDPDVIATADPMHYKLAIFQHTLDLLIARGDAAYRLLERDTLTEAKMFYVQALQLLGPRPDIRITDSWDNPTLSVEAGEIQNPSTRSAEGASLTFAQWLRAGDSNEMGDGDFLPPYNDVLLAYWDKLDIRLYNLRHNLSLDGQPLSLPLFATPVDPSELHRQQSGGDGVQGYISPADTIDTGWRYPLLADHARYAVGQLTQFGSTLLGALERRDGEQLILLLQTQQIAVLGQQQDIAQKNLDSLNAVLESLTTSRASAEMRKSYYTNVINGDLSAAEIAGLTLRSTAMATNLTSLGTLIAGGALSATPNIFGLADGGGDWGAPLHAATQATQIAAMVQDQSATISEITANYQRRKEDWVLQRDLADKDISQAESQINSLKAQIAMQQKQIALAEMESAHAQAVYDLQSSRFTGQVLYDWMVSRLSSLYYQLYDATLPVCLQAREALKRELGNSTTDGIFSMPVWNDLYQGLLAGEGLTTEMQKLENVWIQNSANGLEATRTVSLAVLRGEENGSLSAAVTAVLNGTPDEADVGKLSLVKETGIFSAVLDMSSLNLAEDYGPTSDSKNFFTKSIAVTLPTLLGPYQDIAATLSDGKGTVATLSHGMQDTGRFVVNFDDSRFLPFEGSDPTTLILTLSIFNVKEADDAAPNQRSIVENLSDIIFHIRYIMRDRQS